MAPTAEHGGRARAAARLVLVALVLCALTACGGRRRGGGDPEVDGGSDGGGGGDECDRDGDRYRNSSCSSLRVDCNDDDPLTHEGALDSPWQLQALPEEAEADDLHGLAVTPDGGALLLMRGGSSLVAWRRASAEATWEPRTLGSTSVHAPAAMVTDQDGVAHIAFADGEGTLRLVVGDGETQEIAAEARVAPVAIDLDPSGDPVIAYIQEAELRVLRREGSTTSHVAVDLSRHGADDLCLAVDGDGHFHVVYAHPEDGIRYATDAPRPYPRTRIGHAYGNGTYCALDFDAEGTLHVAYMTGNAVWYGNDESGVLFAERTGIDPGVDSREVGMILAEDGPHLALAVQGYRPAHAYTIDGRWVLELIDNSDTVGRTRFEVRFAKMAAAADGRHVVAYGGNRELHIAVRVGEDGVDQNCNGVAGR